MLVIDGLEWPVPCDITRVSELTASEISGLMLDKTYFNDVLGQYLRYEVSLAVPFNRRELYAQIYERLTAPEDGHAFVLPYNGGTVAITGRVTSVRDNYVRLFDGSVAWQGTSFTVIANHPTRTVTLGEAIARGRTACPEITAPAVGDTYTYTAQGWAPAGYEVAEERRF